MSTYLHPLKAEYCTCVDDLRELIFHYTCSNTIFYSLGSILMLELGVLAYTEYQSNTSALKNACCYYFYSCLIQTLYVFYIMKVFELYR